MENYLRRFRALEEELKEHDFIEIIDFTIYPPATAAQLKVVESKLGAPLAKPIRGFYEQTNGLKLHWRIKPDLSLVETEKLRKKSSDYYVVIAEYVGDPFAMINLIPIHESIVKRRWKELDISRTGKTFEFGGSSHRIEEFRKRLKPFDIINREICMSFLLEQGNGNPPVLLLSDGYTDWNSSILTDFESYMEMLLVTRGIVEARERIFGQEEGDLKPPLIADFQYWKKRHTPKMFN